MICIQLIKKYRLLVLLLITVSGISAMDKAAKARQQHQINEAAQRKLKNAKPTERVSIDPRAGFQLQLAATNRNVQVPHNQKQAKHKKR